MICLRKEILDKLSSRGVLAYVAVSMAGDVEATTAALAGLVRCQTGVMLEGLKEFAIEAPEAIRQEARGKWVCGNGQSVGLQNLDSERYKAFVDDLKKFWDFLNPSVPFSIGAREGAAIKRFLSDHREWTRDMWRTALNNRARSPVNRSQPIFAWIGRLEEYAASPLNEFGRPQEGTGKHGQAVSVEHANRAAKQAFLASS
jgi:hypothetical protein